MVEEPADGPCDEAAVQADVSFEVDEASGRRCMILECVPIARSCVVHASVGVPLAWHPAPGGGGAAGRGLRGRGRGSHRLVS
eukprot:530477-Pyramimonas_sp.AAC.1